MKKVIFLLFLIIFIFGCYNEDNSIYSYKPEPANILIFSPHPDDEVIGVGGRMIQVKKEGYDITVVMMTDGSPKEFDEQEEISAIRKNETLEALELIGINKENVIFLDYDDLGFIFDSDIKVYIDEIKKIIREVNPDEIYIPAYEGGHIDHDSTNFLVISSLSELDKKYKVYEYIEYNAYFWGAPIPVKEDTLNNEIFPVYELIMDVEEVRLKKEMLKKYRSQDPSFKNSREVGFNPKQKSKFNEYEMYLEGRKIPKTIFSSVIGKRIDNCEEEFLVCTYFWKDMIRPLPDYDYTQRAHKPLLGYEKFCKKYGIDFGRFKDIVENN